MYTPLNYEALNLSAGLYNPSQVKSFNNQTFAFWERSLFQRACSVLVFNLPEEWQGNRKDFFLYCLFKYGYLAVFKNDKFGLSFQPCTLNGQDFYYQPINAQISNPLYNATLEIGKECELIKLTPDYMGVWDIISYYAEKLSILDPAINTSIINSKLAYMLIAKNKQAAEAFKKGFDRINKGEPAVVFDSLLKNDPTDKTEPWQFLDRGSIKDTYITTDLLQDFATLLNNFDTEIGIPVLPYQKKERMVVSEAESKTIDATSRSVVWFETLTSSIELVNKMYGSNISVKMRYNDNKVEEVEEDE